MPTNVNLLQQLQMPTLQAASKSGKLQSQAPVQLASDQAKQLFSKIQQGIYGDNQLEQIEQRKRQSAANREAQQQSLQMQQLQQANRERLSKISKDATKSVIDDRRQLSLDAAGKKYLNERQLADWKMTNAKSQQEMQDYAQKLEQYSRRKLQIAQKVQQELLNAIERGYLTEEQALDQESRANLAQLEAALSADIQKQQQDLRSKSALSSLVTSGSIAAIASAGAYATPIGAGVLAAELLLPEQYKPSSVIGGIVG